MGCGQSFQVADSSILKKIQSPVGVLRVTINSCTITDPSSISSSISLFATIKLKNQCKTTKTKSSVPAVKNSQNEAIFNQSFDFIINSDHKFFGRILDVELSEQGRFSKSFLGFGTVDLDELVKIKIQKKNSTKNQINQQVNFKCWINNKSMVIGYVSLVTSFYQVPYQFFNIRFESAIIRKKTRMIGSMNCRVQVTIGQQQQSTSKCLDTKQRPPFWLSEHDIIRVKVPKHDTVKEMKICLLDQNQPVGQVVLQILDLFNLQVDKQSKYAENTQLNGEQTSTLKFSIIRGQSAHFEKKDLVGSKIVTKKIQQTNTDNKNVQLNNENKNIDTNNSKNIIDPNKNAQIIKQDINNSKNVKQINDKPNDIKVNNQDKQKTEKPKQILVPNETKLKQEDQKVVKIKNQQNKQIKQIKNQKIKIKQQNPVILQKQNQIKQINPIEVNKNEQKQDENKQKPLDKTDKTDKHDKSSSLQQTNKQINNTLVIQPKINQNNSNQIKNNDSLKNNNLQQNKNANHNDINTIKLTDQKKPSLNLQQKPIQNINNLQQNSKPTQNYDSTQQKQSSITPKITQHPNILQEKGNIQQINKQGQAHQQQVIKIDEKSNQKTTEHLTEKINKQTTQSNSNIRQEPIKSDKKDTDSTPIQKHQNVQIKQQQETKAQ